MRLNALNAFLSKARREKPMLTWNETRNASLPFWSPHHTEHFMRNYHHIPLHCRYSSNSSVILNHRWNLFAFRIEGQGVLRFLLLLLGTFNFLPSGWKACEASFFLGFKNMNCGKNSKILTNWNIQHFQKKLDSLEMNLLLLRKAFVKPQLYLFIYLLL